MLEVSDKWLTFLILPIIGWLLKKVFDTPSKDDIKSYVELKMAPVGKQIDSLEEKIDSIEERLVRLETKVDRLPELILQVMAAKHLP